MPSQINVKNNDNNVEFTFKTSGFDSTSGSIRYSIEDAENFLVLLKDSILEAKRAKITLIGKEIKELMDDIVSKQQYISKRENDLKNLREQVGMIDENAS